MRKTSLTEGPIGPTILRLAIPSFWGIATVIAFQVVDTYFVGLLGTDALASISFCYPVTFFVLNICMGISIGVTAAVGRSIGQRDEDRARLVATSGVLLAFVVISLCVFAGFASMESLFLFLGAEPRLLGMITSYMGIWFVGAPILSIVMVGNGALRATGDATSPAIVMVVAGLVNVALDPLLIFGLGPVPAMGIAGAAIATASSFVLAAAMWAYLAIVKHRIVVLHFFGLGRIFGAWAAILFVGAPAVATNVLVPITSGIITRIVAPFGVASVAAYGVGQRVESLSMVGFYALATSLVPFCAQNFGAGLIGRMRRGIVFSLRMAMGYGAGIALVLAVLHQPIAQAFSQAQSVSKLAAAYFWVIPWAYGLFGSSLMIGSVFNGIGAPLHSAALMVLRLFGLMIPLGWLGARWGQTYGVFWGMAAAYSLGGVLTFAWLYWFWRGFENRYAHGSAHGSA